MAGMLFLAVPAAAYAAFGAVAVGSSSWGKAWSFPTKSGALHKAKHECSKFGPNCKDVFWVGGTTCGAVNRSRSGRKLYVAFAHSEARAEAKILAAHPTSHFIAAVCADHA
jgi:Domain of unknown function (DUF4189)